MSARSAVLAIACSVAGFTLTAAGVACFVPWPSELGLRAKWEHWVAHRDEYDAVIFGSSFSQYGIDPVALDAELARLGCTQHTFNFAVAGINAYEMDHILRDALALRPARLRRVLVETVSWGVPSGVWVEGEFHKRAICWHTPLETLSVLHSLRVTGSGGYDLEWLGSAAVHVRLMLQRLLSHAQGPAVLASLAGRDNPFDYLQPEDLTHRQGYRPLLESDSEEIAERRTRFLAQGLKLYFERLPGIEPENRRRQRLVQPNEAAVVEQRDLLLATGAEITWFVPPADSGNAAAHALAERGVLPVLLSYNWPTRYPELYRVDARFDRGHLDEAGAARWSQLLARDLVGTASVPAAYDPASFPAASATRER